MKQNKKLEKNIRTLQIERLKDYYKALGLTIIGLNDSQGVNNNMLRYLASMLADESVAPLIIDACSLLMNKTEHIDYFIEGNITVEQIKISQLESAAASFRKVMIDLGLPEFLGNIAYLLYRNKYKVNEGDCNIHLGTTLNDAKEPILIYTSGANNAMREVANNPFAIVGDYKRREETPNFNYTVERCKDPKTLETVIDGVSRNFDTIYSKNSKTDIMALGVFEPKALQTEEMNLIRDLIANYNAALEAKCREYGATFIDTGFIGREHSHSKIDFHGSALGYKILAEHIISKLYEKKFINSATEPHFNSRENILQSAGMESVISAIETDYWAMLDKAKALTGYSQEVAYRIALEHQREKDVMTRALVKPR